MKLTNNDILIRIRYALDLRDLEMVNIFKLGGLEFSKEDVTNLLTRETETDEESDYRLKCNHVTLETFLNGLIIYKRGRQEPTPGQPEVPPMSITSHHQVNNVVLKKLKIALSLTSEDILELLQKAGVEISKSELSAVLRKEGQKNYKECGDRYMRNFLKGLAIKYRQEQPK